MATHVFNLNYTNEPEMTPWISLIELTMLTEVQEVNYLFTCNYKIQALSTDLNTFTMKYVLNLERTVYTFSTHYYSNKEPSIRTYRFVNYYKISLLQSTNNAFYNLYKIYTIKDRLTLDFTFRYINNFYQNKQYLFRQYYKYNQSQKVTYRFDIQNKIRLHDAGKTASDAGQFVFNVGTSKWDYEFSLADINMAHGEYLAVINNGSKYTNYFIDLVVGEGVGDYGQRVFDFRYADGHGDWTYNFDLEYVNNGVTPTLFEFDTRYKIYQINPETYIYDLKYYLEYTDP